MRSTLNRRRVGRLVALIGASCCSRPAPRRQQRHPLTRADRQPDPAELGRGVRFERWRRLHARRLQQRGAGVSHGVDCARFRRRDLRHQCGLRLRRRLSDR